MAAENLYQESLRIMLSTFCRNKKKYLKVFMQLMTLLSKHRMWKDNHNHVYRQDFWQVEFNYEILSQSLTFVKNI